MFDQYIPTDIAAPSRSPRGCVRDDRLCHQNEAPPSSPCMKHKIASPPGVLATPRNLQMTRSRGYPGQIQGDLSPRPKCNDGPDSFGHSHKAHNITKATETDHVPQHDVFCKANLHRDKFRGPPNNFSDGVATCLLAHAWANPEPQIPIRVGEAALPRLGAELARPPVPVAPSPGG